MLRNKNKIRSNVRIRCNVDGQWLMIHIIGVISIESKKEEERKKSKLNENEEKRFILEPNLKLILPPPCQGRR